LLVAYRIAERDHPEKLWQSFIPWATLCLVLWVTALWMMNQPMEMRGTFLGS
jgi:hypothetical protein